MIMVLCKNSKQMSLKGEMPVGTECIGYRSTLLQIIFVESDSIRSDV